MAARRRRRRAPPLQCCATVDDRGAAGTDGLDIRELRLRPDDVQSLAGVRLTSTLRTAVDLLRGAEWGTAEREATARLVRLAGADAVRASLEDSRYTVHRVRAIRRLQEVVAEGATAAKSSPSTGD
ncbi:hypothetical protein [Naasia aerilata]|uniref:Uncharacterized protein n=1 Tax=Naasia aerilata TaxID=1162966 RepID=A0ABM8GF56_9MICO|nr:hypothetical protein [Naasia aerilata]BDZ46945.1 hypothetical protein GCM10025866_28540 [Naasia aerilata]